MPGSRLRKAPLAVLLATVMVLLPGAGRPAQPRLGTGDFPDPRAIESRLVQGVSTSADVQALLGLPNGAGGALLPGFGINRNVVERYDAWYYEDIETRQMRREAGTLRLDMRQQLLVIFLKEGKFHGFFWTSNTITGGPE